MTGIVMDLGKSACRARAEGSQVVWEWGGLPADKAGTADAPALLAATILEGITARPGGDPATVVVGSTFLPPSAQLPGVVHRLRVALPGLGVAILDDGLLAHAGTLGRAGAVASIGTGVIVTLLDEAGGHHRVDGWGPDAGDRGSAVDIGRCGLTAACAAIDGVGPATTLVESIAAHLTRRLDLDAVTWLLAQPDRIVRLADLARVVLADASAGDEIAAAIVEDAARRVTDSCVAALRHDPHLPVVVAGRLGRAEPFATCLAALLAASGLRPTASARGALHASWDIVASAPYAGAAGLIIPPAQRE